MLHSTIPRHSAFTPFVMRTTDRPARSVETEALVVIPWTASGKIYVHKKKAAIVHKRDLITATAAARGLFLRMIDRARRGAPLVPASPPPWKQWAYFGRLAGPPGPSCFLSSPFFILRHSRHSCAPISLLYLCAYVRLWWCLSAPESWNAEFDEEEIASGSMRACAQPDFRRDSFALSRVTCGAERCNLRIIRERNERMPLLCVALKVISFVLAAVGLPV